MVLSPLLQNDRGKAAGMEKKSIVFISWFWASHFLELRIQEWWARHGALGSLSNCLHTWHTTNRLMRYR